MRIAYNPKTSAALTAAPSNNDITFDLSGMAIYARGVKFDGKAYNVFKKHASGNAGGYDGLVPAPSYNNNSKNRFLKEDGTWDTTNTLIWKDDVRATSTIPKDYLNSFTFIGIKNPSAIGLPTTDTFVNLIGWKGYLDKTGPLACELASGQNRISVRFGADETWGNWNTLAYLSDINVMTGATSSKDGKEGLVPKPLKTDYNKVLCGNGDWISLPNCIEIIQSTESFSTIRKSSIVHGYLEKELEKVKGDYGIFSFQTSPYTGEEHYYFRQLKGSAYNDRIQTRVYYKTKNTTDPTYTEWETIAYISDLTWDNIINKPTSFTPSAHEHPTNQINALTGYSKAKDAADLATTDTLNTALGKLEYKADAAYNWYKSIFGPDTDDIINKYDEIVDFVNSVKEGADITDEFVTRKTAQIITGLKQFNNEIQVYTGNYGVRLIGANEVGYLQLGQLLGEGTKVHKGIISGISGNNLESLTVQSKSSIFSGQITATKLITKDGTSSQFVKGDGSLDSNTYLTTTDLNNYLERLPYWRQTETHDPDTLYTGITFAYQNEHNTPTTGTLVALSGSDSSAYALQLQGDYSNANLYFRNKNGNPNGTWNAWSKVVTDKNYTTIGLTTINKTLNVTAAWMDTGISGNNIPDNGTYIVQVYVNGGTIYNCYWSGIMSWYKDSTTDTDSDEILLHRSGKSYNKTIYLRTIITSAGSLKLQIAASENLGASYTYTFKFKKVI